MLLSFLLSFHHTDRLNSHASASDYLDGLNSSFISLTTASFFVAVCNKLHQNTVSSVINHLGLERFRDLKYFHLVRRRALEHLHIQDLFILTKMSVKSITLMTSTIRFSCFLICSNVSSSLTVAMVILDTVGSSVVPTVRLSRLYDFSGEKSRNLG